MRLTYDPEANMAYIQIGPTAFGAIKQSVPVIEDDLPSTLVVDLDAEGHLHGIEIWEADRFLSAEAREQAEEP